MALLPLAAVFRRGHVVTWSGIVLMGSVFSVSTSLGAGANGSKFDLSAASVVVPAGMTAPEKKALAMLIDEVGKRSQVRWRVGNALPPAGQASVILGQRAALLQAFPALADKLNATPTGKPEGYRIFSLPPSTVVVAGNDARGVLFGAGRLLRLLDFDRSRVVLARTDDIATAPAYPLRGHQLGYRPKTNAYDAWDTATWEQYIRDLVIFGANAIEGIPPRSDDAADSPHFPMSPIQGLIEQSRIAQEYGIEFWIWYPALDRDYADPKTVEFALKEWADVLKQLPYVTALFVPGGDPGHTTPKALFPMLEKQTAQLVKLHPGAKMWMSPQGFDAAWMDDFYQIMKGEPTWLEGIVFGPQQRVSLDELRAKMPKRYKMRFYPDITHSLECQYPVPDWDYVFQATENRECTNPRPLDQTAIFHRHQPLAEYGFLTYSEGCNDDVNKFIWSGLGWDPTAKPVDILRDYGHYFLGGSEIAEGFAQGLMGLERNWRGPVVTNPGIDTTLAQFQELERNASPAVLANWRFQAALYRAYYDATNRARAIAEAQQENRALDQLRRATVIGSLAAMDAAQRELAPFEAMPGSAYRARVFELAEGLYQSIRAQLSVPRYRAIAIGRGANLDLIDTPLNNAQYLNDQFTAIRALSGEVDRIRRIDALLNWSNPGPGGFYDNLGDPANSPHLVKAKSYANDPAFLQGPFIGIGGGPRAQGQIVRPFRGAQGTQGPPPVRRISSARFAQTLHEQPLEMWYQDLDPAARYKVRIMYGSGANNAQIRVVANNQLEVQPLQRKPLAPEPVEFDLPADATATGELRLSWRGAPGLGGDGRGVQVAEVWLVRNVPASPPGKRD